MRLALDLLRREPHEVSRFSEAIKRMREEVRYCEVCCNISDEPKCAICRDPNRDSGRLARRRTSAMRSSIENTRQFRGVYHVLGGADPSTDGIGPDDLHTNELQERIRQGGVREVVLALGGTLEGDTTGFYLNRRLAEAGVMVTTIARGISVGASLDQADELTLGRSIADRKPYEQSVKR